MARSHDRAFFLVKSHKSSSINLARRLKRYAAALDENATRALCHGLAMNLELHGYMAKPFGLPELIARIEVMLRRQHATEQNQPVLTVGEIAINRAARTVDVHGNKITLSAKGFDIL